MAEGFLEPVAVAVFFICAAVVFWLNGIAFVEFGALVLVYLLFTCAFSMRIRWVKRAILKAETLRLQDNNRTCF